MASKFIRTVPTRNPRMPTMSCESHQRKLHPPYYINCYISIHHRDVTIIIIMYSIAVLNMLKYKIKTIKNKIKLRSGRYGGHRGRRRELLLRQAPGRGKLTGRLYVPATYSPSPSHTTSMAENGCGTTPEARISANVSMRKSYVNQTPGFQSRGAASRRGRSPRQRRAPL